jgi:CHRD domain
MRTAVRTITLGLLYTAALFLITAILPAQAGAERYNGVLRGKNLTPPVESNGLGSVQLAVVGEQLSWIVSFYDLDSPPIAVHIKGPAGPGESAPVLLDLGNGWGDLGRSNIMSGNATVSRELLASLSAGKWYLVVSTRAHPEGELRTQLERFN